MDNEKIGFFGMKEYTFEDILNIIDPKESNSRIWYCQYEVNKEIEMVKHVMGRQKTVLENQRKEIEWLKPLAKNGIDLAKIVQEDSKEIERLKRMLERVTYYRHVNCKAVNEIIDQGLKEE